MPDERHAVKAYFPKLRSGDQTHEPSGTRTERKRWSWHWVLTLEDTRLCDLVPVAEPGRDPAFGDFGTLELGDETRVFGTSEA